MNLSSITTASVPPHFPFLSQELSDSCQFWPKGGDSKNNNNSSSNDAYLKSVVSPPATTTLRFVIPLRSSSSSSSSSSNMSTNDSVSQKLPDRRPRVVDSASTDGNNNTEDNHQEGENLTTAVGNHIKQFQSLLTKTLNNNIVSIRQQYFQEAFPEVLFITPPPPQPVCSTVTTNPNATCDDDDIHHQPQPSSQTQTQTRRPLYIIVDAGCGEAVLRGADVMAPGILASNRSFEKGEVADFVCSMIAKNPSGNVSIAGNNAPLVGSYIDENFVALVVDEKQKKTSNYYSENTVIVARNCQVVMSRLECFNGKPRSGLAIITNGGIYQHPSLTMLNEINRQIIADHERNKDGAASTNKIITMKPFLQNVSSLFPAAFLMKKLLAVSLSHHRNNQSDFNYNRPLRIIDMCAAPGGKASHVLSQFALTFPKEVAHAGNIRLVCVEKSAPRAKQLKKLLEEHHGEETVNECVLVVQGDSNKILKSGTKESEAVKKFLMMTDDDNKTSSTTDTNNDNSNSLFFDVVLLDPPCTGFGLRPRLRTFEVSDHKGVDASADYQRKLLSTAVSLTRPGGFISYSTCTTSKQENEDSVIFGASSLPLSVLPMSDFASLAMLKKAISSGMCRPTMKLVESNKKNQNADDDDGNSISCEKIPDKIDASVLSSNPSDLACVFRFGPTQTLVNADAERIDSVGFFLSMFQKKI